MEWWRNLSTKEKLAVGAVLGLGLVWLYMRHQSSAAGTAPDNLSTYDPGVSAGYPYAGDGSGNSGIGIPPATGGGGITTPPPSLPVLPPPAPTPPPSPDPYTGPATTPDPVYAPVSSTPAYSPPSTPAYYSPPPPPTNDNAPAYQLPPLVPGAFRTLAEAQAAYAASNPPQGALMDPSQNAAISMYPTTQNATSIWDSFTNSWVAMPGAGQPMPGAPSSVSPSSYSAPSADAPAYGQAPIHDASTFAYSQALAAQMNTGVGAAIASNPPPSVYHALDPNQGLPGPVIQRVASNPPMPQPRKDISGRVTNIAGRPRSMEQPY